jgi:hypothetical protein
MGEKSLGKIFAVLNPSQATRRQTPGAGVPTISINVFFTLGDPGAIRPSFESRTPSFGTLKLLNLFRIFPMTGSNI